MQKPNHPLNIIGTRHGEKQYEALCSREEMFIAQEQGNYYRIPADNRDLNYAKYFETGEKNLDLIEDYNSHNTTRLNINEMKNLLRKLDFIREIESGNITVPEGV
ncbi:UDP-glucose 4-epimerase [Providencia rustigianii]|nr:UDP-glucose 4-epimerase [Providencia rustigianii]